MPPRPPSPGQRQILSGLRLKAGRIGKRTRGGAEPFRTFR